MTKHRVDLSPAFEEAIIRAQPPLKAVLTSLVRAFSSYVNSASHSDFGRDAPLDWPSSAKQAALMHVHIITLHTKADRHLSRRWLRSLPYNRTSNRMLVYAKDSLGNYCLLAYFHDDAHAQLNKATLVGVLAEMAEEWFSMHGTLPHA